MPYLANLLADRVIIDAFQLYGLIEKLAFVKTLKFFLLLISSIYFIFLHNLRLIFEHPDNLIEMLFFLRINQVDLAYFYTFTFLDDRLECLSELLFIQSLEFVVDDYYEFMGLLLM